MADSSVRRGKFERRLGAFLLDAFARIGPVAGEWHLFDVDAMVPDLFVDVTRVDAATGDAVRDPADSCRFTDDLQAFLLDAYANGDRIRGHWEVRYVPTELPAWDVEIRTGTVAFDDATVEFEHSDGVG